MDDKDWLNFYWKYFELHSSQRMQMINFYITVAIVLYGGLFALMQLTPRIPTAEYFVAFFIVLVTVCFRMLDHRTSELIHCCEERLKVLENSLPEEKQLIHKSEAVLKCSTSYSTTFNYLTIVILLSAGAYIGLRMIGQI